MYNIVMFGAPGSGKGTQSARLINQYGLYHISTGDVLRRHISQGSELGKIADSYISKGHLIPDDLMISILEHELDTNPETAKGVIFDGFPRTIDQAKALDTLLQKRGSEVHAVVGLDVDDEELIDRLLKRGLESGRSDDNIDTIRERLNVYHNVTSPLREYYNQAGKYHHIHGSGTVESIYHNIRSSLESRRKK